MKKIEAIVRPLALEPLKEALFQAGITGLTVSEVYGCGNQHGWKEYYRGREVSVTTLPKVKFEVIVDDDQVDGIVEVIIATTRTGEVGDGKIFVHPIEGVVRIRTGERDDAAV